MLQLRLLGPPQISLGGTSVIEALSSKAQAVLFYLAITGRPQARASLATLLWGDTPDEAARTNLRKALVNLREVVGDRLITDRRSVAFRVDSATWVDVIEFKARHQWGDNLSLGSQLEAARGQLERALQLAQTAQLPIVEAEAWRDLGIVHIRQNNYVEAKTIHEQALSLFEALEDRRGATIILMNLATLNSWMGDYTGVQLAYEQALQNFREMEDRWGETLVTINLGDHLYEEGNYTAALALSQRGLQLCRQFQDRANESLVAENLGHILSDLGDYPGAQRYYEQALTISRAIGDRREEAKALSYLGLVCHHLGQHETAYDYCQQARQLSREIGAQALQALTLTYLGHVMVAVNQPGKAAEVYHQALALYQAMGEPQHALSPQAGLANIALTQGELNQALAHTEEILAYLQTKGGVGVQGLFQVYLICYQALQANQDPRAEEALATAHRLLQERAANIDDEQLRRSFLENVPAHRKIVGELANRPRQV